MRKSLASWTGIQTDTPPASPRATSDRSGSGRRPVSLESSRPELRRSRGRFDRNRADAAREGGDAESVLAGPGARAAAVEDHATELRQRAGICAVRNLVDQRAAAEDLWVPERGGALGGDAAGQHLVQA